MQKKRINGKGSNIIQMKRLLTPRQAQSKDFRQSAANPRFLGHRSIKLFKRVCFVDRQVPFPPGDRRGLLFEIQGPF